MDAVLEKENKGKFQSIKNLFKSDSAPKVFVVSTVTGNATEIKVYARYKDAECQFQKISDRSDVFLEDRSNDNGHLFTRKICLDETEIMLEEKELIGG